MCMFLRNTEKYISDKIKKSKARRKVLYGHHTFVSIAGHGMPDPELDVTYVIYLKTVLICI